VISSRPSDGPQTNRNANVAGEKEKRKYARDRERERDRERGGRGESRIVLFELEDLGLSSLED